ncbi:hypothetical protein [Cyanobium sp. CH-040]|uniref:hypothetical protein n=1 Tax=Cyanobium sp. CH-040 TaxID=2823708 RepID=UPI0020CE1F90|nr:hypothetical protein [Cyanobium sp. CH-040]MCP9926824.1 hypothetical protein [Cyanobium sp. CH-040]
MGEERPAPAPAGLDLTDGRNLPAPYQDPWTLLRRDLRAVLASLRLRLWELSRRNRQGDLPLPPFWPRRLGAWFWPLVLALAVAVPAAPLVLARSALPQPQARTLPPSPAAPPSELSLDDRVEVREDQDREPGGPTTREPDGPTVAAAPSGLPASPGQDVEPPAPDPLLALLQPADPRQLVRAVRERPALACLQLELAAGFQALAPAERQRQAETWRQRAVDLGYERLELLDGSGRLLGRTARVGSGMILLDATAGPDVP